MSKPDLNLYIGKKVAAVNMTDIAWQWEIVLDDGTRFINKSREEIMAPTEIVGGKLKTISFSEHDTTLHWEMANGHIQKMSFNPTQYSIHDPAHGGEVYPQWPEELEEDGISSHPEEPVSDKPEETWAGREEQLKAERERRISGEARDFIEETK